MEKSLRDTMKYIDLNEKGIVLVVDNEQKLVDTITDGDIRRAIMSGASLDNPITTLLKKKVRSQSRGPITAPHGTSKTKLYQLMKENVVRQIPLLDNEDRVVDLVSIEEIMPDVSCTPQAVVMAGGLGKRLRPLTKDLPKPMLSIGDRPLLERIIEQLRNSGIKKVNITTHFKSEKISDHFGDGSDFGIDIQYVSENLPLGTAGAVGLIENFNQPILVINGDIITDVDFKAMQAFHQEHSADLTVGVRQYDFKVPYGVIETQGIQLKKLNEKPTYSFFVNAGIYLLDPDVQQFIPKGERYDMTDLINCLLAVNRSVVSFPIIEYWLDIGKHSDYKRAQEDLENGKMKT
jgi:dTDP-glucose pyrophosphorylase